MKHTLLYIALLSAVLCSSCSEWLDVKPTKYTEEDEMFSTVTGFQNALTGVYIELKGSTLYGQNLSMGMLEYMAQHWVANPSDTEGKLSNYEYDEANVETMINSVYAGLYNTILNINNLLRYADNGVLKGKSYNMIKGEALALRAFCHLDILRLFGPVPGQQTDRKMLAYAEKVSKENLQVNTWKEYIDKLARDLDDAEALLKDVDTDGQMNDDYAKYRQNRINYWAVKALKARFYLWIQDKTLAKKYALEVINGSEQRLCDPEDISTRKDYVASKEHLFSLHDFNLKTNTEIFLYRAGGAYMIESYVRNQLFASDVTDVRINTLWKQITETSRTRFVLMKYKQSDDIAKYSGEQIPLIRLYEMYLIAIECSDNADEYTPWTETLTKARNVSNTPNVASTESKNDYVLLEYNREFYGEGQLFYQYKRRGEEHILWADKPGTPSVYVLPLPKSEIKYNQ
ncbi:MAG: RagB/SusD family nutrient uptake outer membrane protein [Prevotella sp.]|nr:RagB/SusD family nutrient uptake outer membrane protein [Prevotella sp.]